MHVAICDDDIAHRKHFERLMKRESDARIASGSPLYIDSFGSEEALFHAPMQYDIFFLSISKEGINALDLATRLREISVQVPIILVQLENSNFPDSIDLKEIHVISDPLKPAQLHEMIDIALSFHESAPKLYEIHSLRDTYYLREDEMIYATGNYDRYMLYMTDDRSFTCDHSLVEYYDMTKGHPNFAFTGKDAIFNFRFLSEIRFASVVLTTGQVLSISLSEKRNIAKAYAAYQKLNS